MGSDHAAAPLLTGQQAGDILATALATAHTELESWTIDSINARPGAETSVGYDVVAGGERFYMVASTVKLSDEQRAAAKAVHLASDEGEVNVWRHPADPYLPGLAIACVPELLAPRLSAVTGRDETVESLDMMVLRPMRRAVLRVRSIAEGSARTWYIKVVRPERADALLSRHQMSQHAPRAFDAGDGIVVVQEAEGIPMTRALHRPDGSAPAELRSEMLIASMNALPSSAVDLKARPAVADRVAQYAKLAIDDGMPAERIDSLVERIEAYLAVAPPHPTVATHGDLHAANMYVDDAHNPTKVVALIDLDTLGPGRRIDDCACMLAHMMVLLELDPEGYKGVPAVADRLLEEFAQVFGRDELKARIAANILSLAAGNDNQEIATAWLETAERLMASPTNGNPQT